MSSVDYLIVGLGNPGKKYEMTWHNLGFLCIEELERRHRFRCDKIRFKGLMADTHLFGSKVLFLKPQTYMNRSGESVRDLCLYYKIPSERLLVVYDDFELPFGNLRIRKQGSAGTHNGMRSIIYQLETDAFPRIRIGFGPKPDDYDVADFVLSKIPKAQSQSCQKLLLAAADAVDLILKEGIDTAMNKKNGFVLE